MGEGTRPARPHARFTEDGRRVREVLSYSRRGSRFSEREQAAWDRRAGTWVIPDEAVDDPGFDLSGWFGRSAPLVVEIGSGVGESLVALAGARPSYDVLAFEVRDSVDLRGEWYGRWPGVVRPQLAWETELVTPGAPATSG